MGRQKTYGALSPVLVANSMKEFLNGITYLETEFIGDIEVISQREYVTNGFEWLGGEKQKIGKSYKSTKSVTIEGGNVFSRKAKAAISMHGDEETKQLLLEVENFKKIPYIVDRNRQIKLPTQKESRDITKLFGKYSEKEKRVPLVYCTSSKQIKSAYATEDNYKFKEFPLTDYLHTWWATPSSAQDTIDDLEMSTANYFKTIVWHLPDGKVVIMDCSKIYLGSESGGPLVALGDSDKLELLYKNNYLPESLTQHLGIFKNVLLRSNIAYIVPYMCGDEKHIWLNDRGKEVKPYTSIYED